MNVKNYVNKHKYILYYYCISVMKKYFIDKNNNDSNNMKLILSNHYNLVNDNVMKRPYNKVNKINNVILPMFGDRDCAPFMTTYKLDYNRPKFYNHLALLNRR